MEHKEEKEEEEEEKEVEERPGKENKEQIDISNDCCVVSVDAVAAAAVH